MLVQIDLAPRHVISELKNILVSKMSEFVELNLEQISVLITDVMTANGCDDANAAALADIMTRAERDGSHSHGLFRVPGYVKALRSGKVDGKAKPVITKNVRKKSLALTRSLQTEIKNYKRKSK